MIDKDVYLDEGYEEELDTPYCYLQYGYKGLGDDTVEQDKEELAGRNLELLGFYYCDDENGEDIDDIAMVIKGPKYKLLQYVEDYLGLEPDEKYYLPYEEFKGLFQEGELKQTHLVEAKQPGDKVLSYNFALSVAKKYGKPVIYGYTDKVRDGKFFSLPLPRLCDKAIGECEREFRNQYRNCDTVYIAYPDKEFIESLDENKEQVEEDYRYGDINVGDKVKVINARAREWIESDYNYAPMSGEEWVFTVTGIGPNNHSGIYELVIENKEAGVENCWVKNNHCKLLAKADSEEGTYKKEDLEEKKEKKVCDSVILDAGNVPLNVEVFNEMNGVAPMVEEIDKELPYGEKAWQLNEIISHMNNENAYGGGWLYIWPDGTEKEECLEIFGDKEDYEDLESAFKRYYKAYHKDGLFDPSEEVLGWAREWDKKLGLSPIEEIGFTHDSLLKEDLTAEKAAEGIELGEDEHICSICGEVYKGFGNNAEPVNSGRCCDECNSAVVIPARVHEFVSNRVVESVEEPSSKEEGVQLFYGVPGVEFIWHGNTADPEVEYKGDRFNYFDLEEFLWDAFKEVVDITGMNDNESEDAFREWVAENNDLVYSELEMLKSMEEPEKEITEDFSFEKKCVEQYRNWAKHSGKDELSEEYDDDALTYVCGYNNITKEQLKEYLKEF